MDIQEFWLMFYVILSRATSLEGFLALRLPTPEQLLARPPKYLLDEIDRLLRLEKNTTKALEGYIKNLPCPVSSAILDLFTDHAETREAQAVSTARARKVDAPVGLGRRVRGKTTLPAHDPRNKAPMTNIEPARRKSQLASTPPEILPGAAAINTTLTATSSDTTPTSATRGNVCVNHTRQMLAPSAATAPTVDVSSSPPAETREIDVAALLGYTRALPDLLIHAGTTPLRNAGNTCYLNALLHSLARVPSLRSWCLHPLLEVI